MEFQDISFGSIKIDGKEYDHDVVIFPDGIERRKKSISKKKHGTSHKFTKKEMKSYIQDISDQIQFLVVGTGQYDKLHLLRGTKNYLDLLNINYLELETPKAIKKFQEVNINREKKLGVFHVTC